jgi:hypothetical protein
MFLNPSSRSEGFLRGRKVSKSFDGCTYAGEIVSYDEIEFLWKVRYDDGDEEEYDEADLKAFMCMDTEVQADDASRTDSVCLSTPTSQLPAKTMGSVCLTAPNVSNKEMVEGATDTTGIKREAMGEPLRLSFDDRDGNGRLKGEGVWVLTESRSTWGWDTKTLPAGPFFCIADANSAAERRFEEYKTMGMMRMRDGEEIRLEARRGF